MILVVLYMCDELDLLIKARATRTFNLSTKGNAGLCVKWTEYYIPLQENENDV